MAQRSAIAAMASAAAAHAAVYNVMDFGAVGDGLHYDTAAVRKAFAAADAAGYGTVQFPSGYTFLTGCFNISANTVVGVEGTILGSPNATDYVLVDYLPWYGPDESLVNATDQREWQPLVHSWYVDNITITGGGVIDGNGWNWWPCASNTSAWPCSGHIRPHGIRLTGGTGFEIYNVTVQNSPMWQVHLSYVTDVYVHDITVQAPPSTDKTHPAHNTDGIDPDCAQNVLVERVHISTGDDCIAIKSGRDWYGRTYGRPTNNVTIRDSTFGQGHGLSIGSEMSGGVYNVLFKNLTATGTGTGIRLKSQRGRGGLVTNITYEDITLNSIAGEAVQMTLNYSPSLPPTNATGTPHLEGVTLRNVTANSPLQGWFLDGLPESPLVNVTLDGVTINNAGKYIQGCDNVVQSSCNGVEPSCPPCVTGRR